MLLAKVIEIKNFAAKPAIAAVAATTRSAAVEAQPAWPAKSSYKLAYKRAGKLSSMKYCYLTLVDSDGTLSLGEEIEFDESNFFLEQKTTDAGHSIEILRERSAISRA
jgi:hypothetical protein